MAEKKLDKKIEPKTIRILSNRHGDIQMKDRVISFQSVHSLDEKTAQWLLKTYPKEIKVIE